MNQFHTMVYWKNIEPEEEFIRNFDSAICPSLQFAGNCVIVPADDHDIIIPTTEFHHITTWVEEEI